MKTITERFWSNVEIKGEDECWEWKGYKNKKGYGYISSKWQGPPLEVYRLSYMLCVGDPGNLYIDHLCRNRSCVNPKHLEAVSNKENILRGNAMGGINTRKTHCKNGHLLPEPTLLWGKIQRRCKTCQKERDKMYWEKRKKR